MKIVRYALLTAMLLPALLSAAEPTKALVDRFLPNYFAAQQAFAADDLQAAQAEAKKLLAIAEAEATFARFTESLQALLATDDLEKGRAQFLKLSDLLRPIVEATGASTDVYVAFCPMAFGYSGGTWLQADDKVLNPYEGDRMLHCGTIQEKIAKK